MILLMYFFQHRPDVISIFLPVLKIFGPSWHKIKKCVLKGTRKRKNGKMFLYMIWSEHNVIRFVPTKIRRSSSLNVDTQNVEMPQD